MKKEIRTLTFHHALNYGAVLQAYALVKFLRNEGMEAKVLNYLPWYFAYQTYRPAKGVKKTLDKLRKIYRFAKFRNKFLPTTSKVIFSSDHLSSGNVFAYICGSDQIWNRRLTTGVPDSGYFLNFAPEGAKKVAYAASSGGHRLDSDLRYLDDFDSLGVREEVLKDEILSEFTDRNVEVVVDPSLLLKDYSEIADYSLIPKEEYILTYVVGSGDTLKFFDDSIAELKKKFNLPVVHIGSKKIASADINILDIGPSEWVAFFEKATFVCTNSFHGTAFSINFEKQFIFIPHCQEELNNRQYTLLDKLDLRSREFKGQASDFVIENIDYAVVTPNLNKFVAASKNYLLESLRV